MNSCLYELNIMHCRTRPKYYKFNHKVFMFYLDLDEVDGLSKRMRLFGREKRRIYNFKDSDHMELGRATLKDNVLKFIREKGVAASVNRIMLLTNVRTFGHIFNPVSFYFCFDENQEPVCVVPEIGNTFGELKLFFIGNDRFREGRFEDRQMKYYYISPFIDLEAPMEFQVTVPDEKVLIKIDDYDKEGKFLYATMSGSRRELNDKMLLAYSFLFPLITLKVITLIHFHAMVLAYWKKIPYHKKKENPDLQKEVLRAHVKN